MNYVYQLLVEFEIARKVIDQDNHYLNLFNRIK